MVSSSYGHFEISSYVASSSLGVLKQVGLEYPIDGWKKNLISRRVITYCDQGVIKTSFRNLKNLQNVKLTAESMGFEPTIPLAVYKLKIMKTQHFLIL